MFTTNGETLGYFLSILMLLPMLLIVAYAIKLPFTFNKKENIDPAFRQRWGKVLNPIRHDNGWQKAYFAIFIARRLLLAICALLISREYSAFIIQIMMVLNIAMTIFLGGAKAKLSKNENNVELANDIITSLAGYHMIVFTDFTGDTQVQVEIGWSFVILLSLMLVANFSMVIKDLIWRAMLRAIKLRRKQEKYNSLAIALLPNLERQYVKELKEK